MVRATVIVAWLVALGPAVTLGIETSHAAMDPGP